MAAARARPCGSDDELAANRAVCYRAVRRWPRRLLAWRPIECMAVARPPRGMATIVLNEARRGRATGEAVYSVAACHAGAAQAMSIKASAISESRPLLALVLREA